jgi:hypothetical protein
MSNYLLRYTGPFLNPLTQSHHVDNGGNLHFSRKNGEIYFTLGSPVNGKLDVLVIMIPHVEGQEIYKYR